MRDSVAPSDTFPTHTPGLPNAQWTEMVDLPANGQFELRIAPVAKQFGGRTVRMLAYNGSIPGPTLRVRQGSEVLVSVLNDGDLEATVHWHGLRLDNRNDGTAATQQPIPVGGQFTYRLAFPDAGVYWYHPHIREDYGQELGLYGNIIVIPSSEDYWPAVDRELTLTVDDLLLEQGHVAPFNRLHPTYTAMGRFGNVLLVNGEIQPSLQARRGEVVRVYLTNTANTRVFNLALPGARLKLVGGDSGRYEQETFVEDILIAPSERFVVDILFDAPGQLNLVHRTPQGTHPLAKIDVADLFSSGAASASFAHLRRNPDMAEERGRLRPYLAAEPNKTLALIAEMDMAAHTAEGAVPAFVCPMHPEVQSAQAERCPKCGMKLVPQHLVPSDEHGTHEHPHNHADDGRSALSEGRYPSGIEWEDDMVEVNRMTNPTNMRWKLIDRETGAEGMSINWRFRVGDKVKIRLINEIDSDHPMHHPFHIHGAGRFLILSRDGVVEPNLVWKDTVLVPTGQTVDLLLDITHPGVWMAHCHIAEHHESGMMLTFHVTP